MTNNLEIEEEAEASEAIGEAIKAVEEEAMIMTNRITEVAESVEKEEEEAEAMKEEATVVVEEVMAEVAEIDIKKKLKILYLIAL